MKTRFVVQAIGAAVLAAVWPAGAQQAEAQALVATAWCHESATSVSMHTTRLRFRPDGSMQVRKDTEMGSGSNNSTTMNARWSLSPGLLIIHEPNGGESRLPMSFAGGGRRVTLGELTYSACR